MSNVAHAQQLLLESSAQYDAKITGEYVVLEKLGMWVQVREVSVMQAPGKALFVSEVEAALAAGQSGIVVTCVAMAENVAAAVSNAIMQWVIGVLPVLTMWREQHTCLASETEIETRGGRFFHLSGPIIARNLPSDPESSPMVDFCNSLLPTLRAKNHKGRVQWIELFASRYRDGAIDATCRLNNRDWSAGKQILMKEPINWPPSQEIMQTCRQFQMLVPVEGDRTSIILPSFFDRILGRA